MMSEELPEGQNSPDIRPIDDPQRQPELQAAAVRRDIEAPLAPGFQSTKQLLEQLQRRRESGELHPDRVPLDYIKLNQPLTRSALMILGKEQAVVLTMLELYELRVFEFVHASGDVMELEPYQVRGSMLILFPEDFGD